MSSPFEGQGDVPVDPDELAGEIEAEAHRRRASGDLSRSAERELERSFRPSIPPPRRRRAVQQIRVLLRQVAERTGINADIPVASDRLLGGPVKAGVRRLTDWYVGAVVSQIRDYTAANQRLLEGIVETLQHIEEDVTRVEEALAKVEESRERESDAGEVPPTS